MQCNKQKRETKSSIKDNEVSRIISTLVDINQEYTTGNRNRPLIIFVYCACYNVTLIIFEGNAAAGNHLSAPADTHFQNVY